MKNPAPQAGAPPDSIRARVSSICDGPHGPFAVAYPMNAKVIADQHITFALSLWPGDMPRPETGQIVILSDIRPFVRGKRAFAVNPAPVDQVDWAQN